MRSSLLIEDQHYETLRNLLDKFSKFQFGKVRLRDLRRDSQHNEEIVASDIEHTIEKNRQLKEEYSELLTEIQRSFKMQIQGIK